MHLIPQASPPQDFPRGLGRLRSSCPRRPGRDQNVSGGHVRDSVGSIRGLRQRQEPGTLCPEKADDELEVGFDRHRSQARHGSTVQHPQPIKDLGGLSVWVEHQLGPLTPCQEGLPHLPLPLPGLGIRTELTGVCLSLFGLNLAKFPNPQSPPP